MELEVINCGCEFPSFHLITADTLKYGFYLFSRQTHTVGSYASISVYPSK